MNGGAQVLANGLAQSHAACKPLSLPCVRDTLIRRNILEMFVLPYHASTRYPRDTSRTGRTATVAAVYR